MFKEQGAAKADVLCFGAADVGLQVNPVALVVQILETFQVHGEVAIDGSTGFALVWDGTDVNITLIPAKQVKMPMEIMVQAMHL